MKHEEPKTLRWLGAVMREDGPHCDVIDTKPDEARPKDGPEWRWMAAAVVDSKRNNLGCKGKQRCSHGAPCQHHEGEAASWWFEWARRKAREERRNAVSLRCIVDGIEHTFSPSLPDDPPTDRPWGHHRRRVVDDKWMGTGAVTAEDAAARWFALTGETLPEVQP